MARAAIVPIEGEDPEQVRGQYRSHSSARMEASEQDPAPGHVEIQVLCDAGTRPSPDTSMY